MQNLATLSQSHDNNFKLIRVSAATGVFISHCFPLAGFGNGGYPSLLGYISLNVFFIISGFLITKSFFRCATLSEYTRARVLRIFPALFLAVICSTFVMGPLFTVLPALDFLTNPGVYDYAFKNVALFLPDIPRELPGVFLDSRHQPIINAPLWSLPYEVWCYTALAAIAIITGARANTSLFYATTGVIFVFLFGIFVANYSFRTEAFAIFLDKEAFRLGAMFSLGILLYGLRHKLFISHRAAFAVICVIGLSSLYRPAFVAITYASLGWLLLYFAYAFTGRIRRFNRCGDYSYGIYIFGYPTQQAVEQLAPDLSLISFSIISFSITLFMAAVSWHFIEKKALTFKA